MKKGIYMISFNKTSTYVAVALPSLAVSNAALFFLRKRLLQSSPQSCQRINNIFKILHGATFAIATIGLVASLFFSPAQMSVKDKFYLLQRSIIRDMFKAYTDALSKLPPETPATQETLDHVAAQLHQTTVSLDLPEKLRASSEIVQQVFAKMVSTIELTAQANLYLSQIFTTMDRVVSPTASHEFVASFTWPAVQPLLREAGI